MPDIYRKFDVDADVSYTAAEPIIGGQLVERRAGARLVGVAAAGSLHVVGVAKFDMPATRATIQGNQVGDVDALTVMRGVVPVTYSGSAAEGDKLVATANGQVTAAGATPDARTIVGEAFEAASAGQTKLARIY